MEYKILSFDDKPNAGYVSNGIKLTNVELLHNQGFFGENMRIGVIDTGCFIEHKFIKDNILCGKNFTSSNSEDFTDKNNHGTFCIGEIVQIAPKCQVVVAKALDDKGNGGYDSILNAFNYCIEQNCHVISMSLGGTDGSENLHNAIKLANERGIIVCVSAGNSGDGVDSTDEFSYPGAYEEVVNVGAINEDKSIAKYSNSNKWVDVCAVGTNITSTYLDNKWCQSSGTSMATPQVSSICLLLREKFIKEWEREPSEDELYSQLIKNTVDLKISKRFQGNGMVYIKGEE